LNCEFAFKVSGQFNYGFNQPFIVTTDETSTQKPIPSSEALAFFTGKMGL
jgi:hypothetical protein